MQPPKCHQPLTSHRLILRPESRLRKITPAKVINEIIPDVPVPILESQKAGAEDYFQ